MVLRPGPDPVYYELLIIPVLLILRTSLCDKSMEPLEPQLDRTILRNVAGFSSLHSSFFLIYFGQKTYLNP